MVINENNSQINSFTKGMNSDTSFDQIENTQYIFGQNIRIAKNQPLGTSGDYSSVHEGIVTPVWIGEDRMETAIKKDIPQNSRILAVHSSSEELNGTENNFGIILTTTGTDLDIYKVYMYSNDSIHYIIKLLWHSDNVWPDGAPDKVSSVLYKELENVIKLYIATGRHPVVSLRVDKDSENKYKEENNGVTSYTPIDKLINNREVPTNRVYIDSIISGKLVTSQVQYTYRYYNKYGNTTQLAPLTNKIQVIDPSRSKEGGNAENTQTSVGFRLKIKLNNFDKYYDRLQIFRLSYIKEGQDSEIDLIYDGLIAGDEDGDDAQFTFNDVGVNPLQTLSIEEFSAMSGLILIPQTIEQNQEYMFCANVKDDTIIKDAEYVAPGDINPLFEGKEYEVISADVVLSDNIQGDIPDPGNHPYSTENYDIHILKVDNQGQYTGETYVAPYMNIGDYFEQRGINITSEGHLVKASYNDIMTSSLLRSLRRDETYRYAIIFYDNKGRRTDVMDLCDIKTPEYLEYRPFIIENSKLIARPIGVRLAIPGLRGLDDETKIIGCQIVRRSSSDVYQKNLLQVALSRPVSQSIFDVNTNPSDVNDDESQKSPFYPTGLLSVLDTLIYPSYYGDSNEYPGHQVNSWSRSPYDKEFGAKTRNRKLYQVFSSEIDFRRNDVLSRINVSDTKIKEVFYPNSVLAKYKNSIKDTTYFAALPESMSIVYSQYPTLEIDRRSVEKLTIDAKQSNHWIYNFYYDRSPNMSYFNSNTDGCEINQIKDVKIPEWSSGFSEIQRIGNGQELLTAIKKYKSYSTNIDSFTYNNWISFAKYGLKAGTEDQANMDWSSNWLDVEMLSDSEQYNDWLNTGSEFYVRNGFIGAGSSCYILTTKEETGGFPLDSFDSHIRTSICNIQHIPELSDVESKDYIQYYGFGNFFNLEEIRRPDGIRTFALPPTQGSQTYLTVFDGDIYITPHEFTTMYKAYDFNSADTLQSTQVVNYVPLESKVNTCFDYGMNMVNTNSENLMYEPGYIDGIITQDRPAHQYNMIYSDNDASNDVFTLISTDKNETNEFRQRAYYSDLKTNGEFIDNFLIFKTAAFIDVDSRYGEITNLLTDKNMLYYWQQHACGKFSVNERSLVNDQNNNTIMLGQAGILSRYDYLSTKYGMRLHDFCARAVDNGAVFWVDINNKAIPAISGNGVLNYGEQANVQNIINNRITSDVPYVDYDLQNDELLCKCLTDGDQLVFNTKYNIATSIYTRRYNDILYIKNHIYGLTIDEDEDNENIWRLNITKHNYINNINSYLSPIQLQFVVNPMASITKVFDSQQLVPIKRTSFTSVDHAPMLDNTTMSFETDITSKTFGNSMEPYTDREGNIIYNIPRFVDGDGYGNRIRGKWLRVNINNEEPTELFTISHILTKFRQSYS